VHVTRELEMKAIAYEQHANGEVALLQGKLSEARIFQYPSMGEYSSIGEYSLK